MVKRAIETTLPSTLHVVGEISNFKRHTSGHLYFTLKDTHSELSCVMWRSQAVKLKFDPTDGMSVIATGGVEVFERTGRYQLYVRKLEPRGVGALELAFRQLCEKLEDEGLFDERHKQPIPAYPSRIALITSPTGAAIVDILRTIDLRFPCVSVLIYPVPVQGEGAADQVAAAIRKINAQAARLGGIDVIIVGRGGGSLEDLWAFNEEVVARAIHASRVPIISAVGHEVDVTIADLVADVRAATPTAAAELAVPVLDEVLRVVATHEQRLARGIQARIDVDEARLTGLLQRGPFRDPLATIHRREQLLDEWSHRAHRAVRERVYANRNVLDRLEAIVQRIAPHAILLRSSVRLRDGKHRLRWAMSRRWALGERRMTDRAVQLERASPAHAIRRHGHSVELLHERVSTLSHHKLSLMLASLKRHEQRLLALSHKSVLERGFSVTRMRKGRRIVRSVGQLADHQRLITELADGEFESQVLNLEQLELFDDHG